MKINGICDACEKEINVYEAFATDFCDPHELCKECLFKLPELKYDIDENIYYFEKNKSFLNE